MRPGVLVVFVIVLVSHATSQTQPVAEKSRVETFAADVATVWKHTGEFFLSPLHFDGTAWLETGVVCGGTAALFSLDNPARSWIARNHSSTGDRLSEIGKQYGQAIYGIGLSGTLYVGGLAFDNDEVRTTGLMLFESLAFAGITTSVIKSLAGRGRPYLGEGNTTFKGIGSDDDYLSLPSGHATVAFSVSSVMAGRIKNTFATIGLYSLAAITAYSRIYDDEHWLSDTFLGAAIGTIAGISVINMHAERGNASTLKISPTLNGLRISYMLR